MAKITALLQSKWVAAVLGMVLFFITTAFMVTLTVPPAAAPGDDAHAHARMTGPSWDFFNPEVDQMIDELRQERVQLETKEKQLDELEARLKSERAELDSAVRSVRKLQSEFDRDMTRIKDDEVANLKKLAKMYALMEPPGAASILKELDDTVLVKIFLLMKEAETAPVLEALARLGPDDTKRAARISEILRLAVPVKAAPPKS